MNERSALTSVIVLAALLAPLPASACRDLVQFPEHLAVGGQEDRGSYYVALVQRVVGESFAVEVQQSFGGPLAPGAVATVVFAQSEESHAVCPITIVPGITYLFRGRVSGTRIEVSRYNWLNVPSTHERFATYVRDLQRSK